MAKLIYTALSLAIFDVARTIRSLLQSASGKKWLFTSGTGTAFEPLDGGGTVKMYAIPSADTIPSTNDWEELTVTVDGREKIKIESAGNVNLAPLYKTAETIYFKHLGEFLDGMATGKFPTLAGSQAVVIDQTAQKIWVLPAAVNSATWTNNPSLAAEIEVDQPTNDFGE